MRNYRYQYQIGDQWCGAACLSMIYDRHKISCSQEKVYNDLKKPIHEPLFVAEIVNHVGMNNDLFASAIQFKDVTEFLTNACKNNIDMIMSHTCKDSNSAHFTLFTDFKDNMVYGLDPFSRENFPITLEEMERLWQRNESASNCFVAGQVAILISSDDDEIKHMPCCVCGHDIALLKINNKIEHSILCSKCDRWRIFVSIENK